MKINLYQEVTITRDVPEQDLLAGDVATLLDYVPHPQGEEEGAVLELFNALGESVGVRVVPASLIAPLQANQMPTVRPIMPQVVYGD
jgi:hypothetical protein